MGMTNWVHLEDCKVLAVTESAVLVLYDEEKIWLPKSQLSDPDTYEADDEGVTVTCTEWIAKQKGIDFES